MTLLEKLDLPEVDIEFRCKEIVIDGENYMVGVDKVRFFGTENLYGTVYVDRKLKREIKREISLPSVLLTRRKNHDYKEFLQNISEEIKYHYVSKMSWEKMNVCFGPIYEHYKKTFRS